MGMIHAGLSQRYQETGSVSERQRTRATSQIEDRFIRLLALRDRTVTAQQLVIRLHDYSSSACK